MENRASAPAEGGTTNDSLYDREVDFYKSYQRNGSTTVNLTHFIEKMNLRVIALDNDGNIHTARKSSSRTNEGHTNASLSFELPLAQIKSFQLQTRPYEWVTFRNVSLQHGLKTDVMVEGERPTTQTDIQKELRTILLPDVDNRAVMLDLANCELVEVRKADTPAEIKLAIEKLDKGNLVFDSSSLILVRGTTSRSVPENANEPFPVYKIGMKLPEVFKVKTNENIEWTIEIHSLDDQGCRLQYYPVNPKNHVSAIPLTTLQRKLIAQMLKQVEEIDRKTEGKAMHRPFGPMLYHVDAQGQVTIWAYQHLPRGTKDFAQDEAGWGSSRLANAKGMYYLPDGTPLQSRWRWRTKPNGMTDIRIKVGRPIAKDERVGLIHRYNLPADCDLYSRDGCRSIMLDTYIDMSLLAIVRMDHPMRLKSWTLGNAESDIQYLDEYDQVTVTSQAKGSRGPMLVTFRSTESAVDNAPEGKNH